MPSSRPKTTSTKKEKAFAKQKFLITGGRGFLGKFVIAGLQKRGVPEKNIITFRSKDYDLREMKACQKVVKGIDTIIHLAANVGGIGYNRDYPASLFYDNLMMGVQLMEAARLANVHKFVAIGTICAYPKHTPVPFREEDLWSGYPEETNAPYGLAKKMLLVQAEAYRHQYGMNAIYLLPVNLYGPGDNFKPESSHVIPALIKKIQDAIDTNAKEIEVWGDGSASREFLYVEDAAEGIILATEKYNKSAPVNLGAGFEITIKELVTLLSKLMGFKGKIVWDATKPNGQPRRKLDVSRAKTEFDFEAKVHFEEGLEKTIAWYREHRHDQVKPAKKAKAKVKSKPTKRLPRKK